nr:ulp1 protease family, C-terminal catalytic domain-containing protein [Tanacetum cinerariifolium]
MNYTDIDYREESETEEESGEMVLKRSSTTVITKWTARKLIMLQKEMIASNKNTIAPDTDIETHETNAAKTTPEKERMTKSKIIVAKNVVSQSPIKAVNLGDISGKSSNGISNTPKDAQVTASGLRKKITMLEVLMNGIVRDLEKAIQQHPGDKEFESIKLQWNKKLLKIESEMKKDKERPCKQIFEADRDKKEHQDPVKVVSTVEESSSALPANDIPSFDLGLTPTPPDVNVNADKEDVPNKDPMLENIPVTFTRISAKLRCTQEEDLFFDCIFRATRNPCDYLFVTEEGFRVIRSVIESLYPGFTIHIGVINMWSQVCIFEERLRSPDSMRRLFCHSSIISEKTLNEKDNVKALTYFIDDMKFVMKSAKVDNISNSDMVLFPVLLAKSHYYLLVFKLKTPKIEILDNSKNGTNVALDERYGESFTKLKKLFIQYVSYSEHRSWNLKELENRK